MCRVRTKDISGYVMFSLDATSGNVCVGGLSSQLKGSLELPGIMVKEYQR